MVKKSRSVTREKLPAIAAAMRTQAKTPNTLSLEQMVKELAKEIQAMLDAGYGYEDVANLFTKYGVEIAPSSIKSYHRRSKTSAAPEAGESESVTEGQNHAAKPPANPEVSIGTQAKAARKEGESRVTRPAKQDKAGSTPKTESEFNITNREEL